MTYIKDIMEFCNTFAPFSTQEEWDNSGLNIGNPDTKIQKVLLSLDITLDTVSEAKEKDVDLIISHHPVIFTPQKSIAFGTVCAKLVQNNISALCLHTNLDKAQEIGVNEILAKTLQLQNTELFPDEFLCIGELEKEMSSDDFAEYVKSKLNSKSVRYTDCKNIKKVAVSSGGGGDAVFLFDKYKFDALVTGELKHHQFIFAKERSFCAVDAGHFATENVVINPLCDMLSQKFSDVKFLISEHQSDYAFAK